MKLKKMIWKRSPKLGRVRTNCTEHEIVGKEKFPGG